MTLDIILKLLSKSSPYSVSTLGKPYDEFYEIKEYLYLENPIEIDFKNSLKESQNESITFLCGSSGDGKSEILTRCNAIYNDVVFHLDATHSLSQHTSAIDSLNDAFTEHKKNKSKMAVGINIGMMQKFIKVGSEDHKDIKESMRIFFENRYVKGFSYRNHTFFDFDCYPRVTFDNNTITSDFVLKLLNKLTLQEKGNPFWSAFSKENPNSQLYKNFNLLSNECFKIKLIQLFGMARLYKEQFLTPRTLIDYIYQILTFKNQALVVNVFTPFDNDLSKKVCLFDPRRFDNNELDDFILRFSLGLLSDPVKEQINQLVDVYGDLKSAKEIILLFYFVQDEMIGSDLYRMLNGSMNSNILSTYLEFYHLMRLKELNNEQKDRLEDIVYSCVIKGIKCFINRTCPAFNEDYLLVRRIDGNYIGVKSQIEFEVESVSRINSSQNDRVSLELIINDDDAYKIEIDINLFELLNKIINGYYPNMQRKTNVLMLDDIAEKIISKSLSSRKIIIMNDEGVRTIENKERRFAVEYI